MENQYSWPHIVRCWVDLMHMHISEVNIPYQLTFLWIHGFKSTLSVIKHYINIYCIRTCHNVVYKLFLIPINKHMKITFYFTFNQVLGSMISCFNNDSRRHVSKSLSPPEKKNDKIIFYKWRKTPWLQHRRKDYNNIVWEVLGKMRHMKRALSRFWLMTNNGKLSLLREINLEWLQLLKGCVYSDKQQ